jgi:hypothetical protein
MCYHRAFPFRFGLFLCNNLLFAWENGWLHPLLTKSAGRGVSLLLNRA